MRNVNKAVSRLLKAYNLIDAMDTIELDLILERVEERQIALKSLETPKDTITIEWPKLRSKPKF